jgi:hypothetical protein
MRRSGHSPRSIGWRRENAYGAAEQARYRVRGRQRRNPTAPEGRGGSPKPSGRLAPGRGLLSREVLHRLPGHARRSNLRPSGGASAVALVKEGATPSSSCLLPHTRWPHEERPQPTHELAVGYAYLTRNA